MKAVWGSLALLVALAPATAQLMRPPPVSAPRLKLNFGGQDREYLLQLPSGKGRGRALIMALHGGTRSATDIFRQPGWPEIAARAGAVLIAPEAIGHNWNDGRSIYYGQFDPSGVDDVGFLTALVAKAVADYGVDPRQVYFTGASNGGNMTWRMACERPGLIAAISPVISTMPSEPATNCRTPKPIPVVAFFGTADPLMRYDGASFTAPNGRKTEPRSTAPDSTAFWAKLNGCASTTQQEALPDRDKTDGTTVIRYTYDRCPGGKAVIRYDTVGGGHTVPGGRSIPGFEGMFGKANRDISYAEIAWDFFQRQRQSAR